MGEENSRSVLDLELLEGLWTLLGREREILDIWELSKERYRGDKIVFELPRRLVPVGVEDEDEEVPKIVEKGPGEFLI